jgi:hypothetical protein
MTRLLSKLLVTTALLSAPARADTITIGVWDGNSGCYLNFERYKLTFGPTPIEKLFRLTAQIFAKREDCNSGLAYGGNKLRKLEYIVPDVIASNADTLVGAMR